MHNTAIRRTSIPYSTSAAPSASRKNPVAVFISHFIVASHTWGNDRYFEEEFECCVLLQDNINGRATVSGEVRGYPQPPSLTTHLRQQESDGDQTVTRICRCYSDARPNPVHECCRFLRRHSLPRANGDDSTRPIVEAVGAILRSRQLGNLEAKSGALETDAQHSSFGVTDGLREDISNPKPSKNLHRLASSVAARTRQNKGFRQSRPRVGPTVSLGWLLWFSRHSCR